MTVSMQNLVADPELAAIQRRREMLMGILRSNNQNQNYTSAVSPLGPVANALAAALLDYTGKREEDQLSARRGEELQQFGRNVPSLGALLGGGSPAASAIPNTPPPSAEVAPPRAIPASASLPAPTLPNGRPDFSRMADSAPAAPGQGFDPRQQHAQFAAMRREAMDTLSGPALDQRLAQISAQEAQVSSGLPTGPVYRRPEAERGSLWAAAAPAAAPSGAVPALGTPGGAPQAIPAQATPPQVAAAPQAASGTSPQALQAAAAQRLQMAAEAAQSSNPRIREQASRLQSEAQFLMTMAQREAPRMTEVRTADGVFLVDPSNPNRRVRIGDDPAAAPVSPARHAQDLARAQAGATNVQQRVSMEPERAEGAARGTSLGEEGTRVRTAAEAAAGTIDQIRMTRSLGATTGRLAPMQEMFGGWMEALGVPASMSRAVRQASDLQAFNAIASNVVLGRQLEQRGVQTEGDREVIRSTYATITNTNDANDFILRAQEAQAERLMERADFYQQWRQQPGANGQPRNSLDGAAEAWNRYIRQTPLVARAGNGVIYLNEWLPEAVRSMNGNREEALRVWRENAGQRRR